MGTYGRPCKACGARLDPGERCDCEKRAASNVARLNQRGGGFVVADDKRIREYVTVRAEHSAGGDVKPLAIKWKDDLWYEIDRASKPRQAAALKAGGQGLRYTVRIKERETYLFYDNGVWFVEAKCRAA